MKRYLLAAVILAAAAAWAQSSGGNHGSSAGGSAFAGGTAGTSFQDVTETAVPANPAAGVERWYADSSSHLASCITSSGSTCFGAGTPSFPVTVAGTVNSGGIPYFNSTTQESSSALLTANSVMIGGGAGAAPSTILTDTVTTHALMATAGSPAFRALVAGDMPSQVVLNNAANVGTANFTLDAHGCTGANCIRIAEQPGCTAAGQPGTICRNTTDLMFHVNTNGGDSAVIGVVGKTSQKAETTTADANVLTVTPPAAVGTYDVCVTISVLSATSGVIGWTLSWTDSNANALSNIAQPLFQIQTGAGGTAAPALTFTTSAASNYYACSRIDINIGAASIIVKWVGGGTTTAKMSATIERIQ